MGNNQSKNNTALKEWEKVDTDNGIEIYKNVKTNQLAEKRLITLQPQLDIKKQVKLYQLRQNNTDALVKAFNTKELAQKASSFPSCAGKTQVAVYTQKMPHRLSQLPPLTFPQCLLFLRQSFRAYQKIYRQYGPVQVTQQMIGLNYLGEVKSWLNSNWALNHRSHEYGNLRSKKISQLNRQQYLTYRQQYLSQQQMVKSIIQSIQKKCQQGHFPQVIKQQMFSQSDSFKKAILYVKDFIGFNQLFVPDGLNYNDLVQHSYQVRLEHQNSLIGVNNQQGQQNNQQISQKHNQFDSHQAHGHQSFFNSYAQMNGNQQINQPQIINQQRTQQFNVNQFQAGSNINQGNINRHHHMIPQPIKQSPASTDLGHITFSQANRTYGQQSSSPIKTTQNQSIFNSNYQFSNNVNNLYNPAVQKTQPQNQVSSYSTNYSFGGILKNENNPTPSYQASTTTTSYQQASYQSNLQSAKYSYTATGNNLTTNNNLNSSYSPKPTLNNDLNTRGSTFTIGNYEAPQTYQNPTSLGYSNSHFQVSQNGLTANKWGYNPPTTSSNYVIEHYNGPKTTNLNSTTFSFDGHSDSHSKFGQGYSGSGYSNTLTRYESQVNSNPTNLIKIQDHHEHGVVSPSFKSHIHQKIVLSSPHHEHFVHEHSHSPHTRQTVIVTSTSHKRQTTSNPISSHVSEHHVISGNQSNNVAAIDALNKLIQRSSNNVSESVLKEN